MLYYLLCMKRKKTLAQIQLSLRAKIQQNYFYLFRWPRLSCQLHRILLVNPTQVIFQHFSVFVCVTQMTNHPSKYLTCSWISPELKAASNHYCDLYEPDRTPICFIFKRPSPLTTQLLFGKIECFSRHAYLRQQMLVGNNHGF